MPLLKPHILGSTVEASFASSSVHYYSRSDFSIKPDWPVHYVLLGSQQAWIKVCFYSVAGHLRTLPWPVHSKCPLQQDAVSTAAPCLLQHSTGWCQGAVMATVLRWQNSRCHSRLSLTNSLEHVEDLCTALVLHSLLLVSTVKHLRVKLTLILPWYMACFLLIFRDLLFSDNVSRLPWVTSHKYQAGSL